jgi:hypothetical protein
MAFGTWQAVVDALDPVIMTVRAQALSPLDTGESLIWDVHFPKQDVDSVNLQDVTTVDYRPTADRREWNARGRNIPAPTPARRTVQIVPIESFFKLDEQEMQRLSENGGENARILRDLIGVSIPARVDRLVGANYRRLEVDAVTAWTAGTITQRNPENAAQTYTASFGISGSRITTAGTAWNDVSVNAYDLLLAWIAAAEDLVGSIEGVMLRLASLNAILADAPNLPNSVKMTRTELADRITQDRGSPWTFFVNENSVDVFDDGGLTYTRTKVWPAQKIAAVPVGKAVGKTAFAPVARAQEISDLIPEAGVDVRGVSVYHEMSNGGRELTVEAQLNALPVPDEQRIYVTNIGV